MSKEPTGTNWIDPNDASDPSARNWRKKFALASLREGEKIVRPGRAPLTLPKRQVSLPVDYDVARAISTKTDLVGRRA